MYADAVLAVVLKLESSPKDALSVDSTYHYNYTGIMCDVANVVL